MTPALVRRFMTRESNVSRETLAALIERRRSVREYSQRAVSQTALECILYSAQGDSGAGKRNAPSAHGLYPLSLFTLVRRVDGPSVDPGLHWVDQSCGRLGGRIATVASDALLSTSLADDQWLEQAAAVVVVAANYDAARSHFADQQADGRRGDRYIYMEAGAVLQNMHLMTLAEGLGGVIVAGFDDARLAATLDLPGGLAPVALFCIGALFE